MAASTPTVALRGLTAASTRPVRKRRRSLLSDPALEWRTDDLEASVTENHPPQKQRRGAVVDTNAFF